MKTRFVIILVTCGSKAQARGIAAGLLKKRLVKCANIIAGVESRFRWKERIDRARETIVLLKARKGDFRTIERRIRCLHSYEVPEIIALPILQGSRDYMRWLDE